MPTDFKRTGLAVAGLTAIFGLGTRPAQAQIITGTSTGAAGANVSGTTSPGLGADFLMGGYGSPGGTAYGTTNIVVNATLTGGRGGSANGTAGADDVAGGPGGAGLNEQINGLVTITSGTFTGGAGGTTSGVASNYLSAGQGGDGLYVNASTAIINGGTFQGGAGVAAGGTAPNLDGGAAGSGLQANYQAMVTINGGTFTGGSAANETNPNGFANDGVPYAGVNTLTGAVSIYGGTFTGGTFIAPGPPGTQTFTYGYGLVAGLGSTTLYGSNFTVNGIPNFSGLVPLGTGTITGKLQNNAAVTTITYDYVQYYNNQNGTFTIVSPTPEPSTWAAFGFTALGVGGLMLRTRRRKAV